MTSSPIFKISFSVFSSAWPFESSEIYSDIIPTSNQALFLKYIHTPLLSIGGTRTQEDKESIINPNITVVSRDGILVLKMNFMLINIIQWND